MLSKMLEVLSNNYKRYLPWTLLGLLISLVLFSITRSEHIIVRSILTCFALFCGYWFLDLKKSVFSNKTETISGYITFIVLFIIISFIARILFGYTLGIISQVVCFFVTIFLGTHITIKRDK